jgi:hypothetical protein
MPASLGGEEVDMRFWQALLLLTLAGCATAGEYPADDDTPADDAPDGAQAPTLDAGEARVDAAGPQVVDGAPAVIVDAAPPPPDAAPPPPPDAAPNGLFCVSHVQCDQAAHECCAFLPPDFTAGICGHGNIVLGACLLTPQPDAGP